VTFSTFDVALPIGLGIAFGLFRYMERRGSAPEIALRSGLQDGLQGIIGMGILTVILKYFHMI